MKKIFVFIIVLTSIQMSAQTIVKAKLVTFADDSNFKEMEAVCENPGFDCIARNFDFPPNIGDNIVYAKDPDSLGVVDTPGNFDIYNLFDSLGRVRTYFYFGSMVSGMMPQGYLFEYAENTDIIIRLTDDADNSTYNLIYLDGLIVGIKHYNDEGVLLEALELSYE